MTCPSIREIEFTPDRPSWFYPMNDEGGKARMEDTVNTEWPNTCCEA
jgi:hypothetical protein